MCFRACLCPHCSLPYRGQQVAVPGVRWVLEDVVGLTETAGAVQDSQGGEGRGGRGQPMILWMVLITLWSSFLSATVQLLNHSRMQHVSRLSTEHLEKDTNSSCASWFSLSLLRQCSLQRAFSMVLEVFVLQVRLSSKGGRPGI